MLYATTTNAPVFGLRREIDRLFEDAFGAGRTGRSEWSPAVDICETDQELTFAVELSGLTQDDVEVIAENGIMTVRGDRTTSREAGQDSRYYLVERNHGSFMRRFQLPQGVDTDKINANVENGLLLVHIPKTALPQPKRISISTGPHAALNVGVNGSVKTQPTLGQGESSSNKVSAAQYAK
jgi:HSP20 family protein